MESMISLIRQYKSGNPNASAQIADRMTPLIKKYAAKIHCMEYEDALQELSLTLLETLPYLDDKQSEGKCVKYMETAVINRYYALCKQYLSIPEAENIENSSNTLAAPPAFDETYYDVTAYICSFPDGSIKRQILSLFFYQDKSDTEIADMLHISRQYVNRVKKQLIRDYFTQCK